MFDIKKWINNKRFKNGSKDTMAEFRNNDFDSFSNFLNSSDLAMFWYP